MRSNSALLKRIKITFQAGSGVGPMRQIKWAAQDLAKNTRKIPGAFKHETLSGVTRGTEKIWAKWGGFVKNAANLASSAELLALAADNQEMSGVKNGIKTLGANCGGCHKAFRVKKKRHKKMAKMKKKK